MEIISADILEKKLRVVRQKLLAAQENLGEEEALHIIEEVVFSETLDLQISEIAALIQKLYAKTRSRLGMLETYIEDESVNEIMLNGKDCFFLEKGGEMTAMEPVFDSTEELEEIIRNIAAGVHREINEMHPILDARLPGGSRVNAVYKNIAAGGPALTIRKFSKERITISQMVEFGTLTEECAAYLKTLVQCGYNIFVSGGTSSGKTTFLNALSDFIPCGERVIVIEDSAELKMSHIPNLVQMECRNANGLGQGRVSMDMLIKTSLRMRPDRIIVGEVRGGEVADMINAMNTGHDGCLATGHGNSVSGMLRRLEAMYLMGVQIPMDAIRAQMIEGIDVMVHLGRLPGGHRKILEIQELVDFVNGKYVLNPLFLLDENRQLAFTGNALVHGAKLRLRGGHL